MNLPPFPELPASPESRLRWAAWGEECARAGMEEAAKICDRLDGLTGIGNTLGPDDCAEEIRAEAQRIDRGEKFAPGESFGVTNIRRFEGSNETKAPTLRRGPGQSR